MTSDAQKRVQVAMDVIKHLNTETLKSAPQQYLRLAGDLEMEVGYSTQVQDIIKAQTKPCGVCALGACFLSMVRRYNDFTVSDLKVNEWDPMAKDEDKGYDFVKSNLGNLSRNLMPYLERLFDKDQLLAIEIAYEGINLSGSFTGDGSDKDDPDLLLAAHEFHMDRAEYDRTDNEFWFDPEGEFLECGMEESRNDDGNALLRDIMKNIIRNKGTFKP